MSTPVTPYEPDPRQQTPLTEPQGAAAYGATPYPSVAGGGTDLLGTLPESDDLARTLRAHQTGRKLSKPVIGLLAVAVLGVGVVGGVGLSQAFGDDGSTTVGTFAGAPGAQAGGAAGALPDGEGAAAGGGFPGGGGGAGGFGGATSGTVTAVDGDTLTVTTQDGSTVTVTASDDTTVSVTQDATVADLVEGDTVVVSGDTDDDGNVAATSITEGATFGGFGGGQGGGPGGAAPTG